ncbi:hypothetical protein [Beijerinckia indica]|uniref:hypothetical protein n=1 Tax=Beijerinckia indica TaxID=533 RepID=UPI0011D07761|nr:hypothetical protein [Beijerinckia indica]
MAGSRKELFGARLSSSAQPICFNPYKSRADTPGYRVAGDLNDRILSLSVEQTYAAVLDGRLALLAETVFLRMTTPSPSFWATFIAVVQTSALV